MKFIISHDVDHLYTTDHLKDLYYPKLLFRSTMNFINRKISIEEWLLRWSSMFRNKANYIPELMEFDKYYNIPSVFFFGMANGKGLSYKQKRAFPIIKDVKDKSFDVGVHGIDYESLEGIQKEYNDFSKGTEINSFGIRMHYVNSNENTFNYLAEAGYIFDSSEFNKTDEYLIKKPYLVGDMWEFPLCLMDSYLPYNLEEAKKFSLDIIDKAKQTKIPYFTVLFHDIHFCSAYKTNKEWYQWLIEYLLLKGYAFISYREAIKELNKEKEVI